MVTMVVTDATPFTSVDGTASSPRGFEKLAMPPGPMIPADDGDITGTMGEVDSPTVGTDSTDGRVNTLFTSPAMLDTSPPGRFAGTSVGIAEDSGGASEKGPGNGILATGRIETVCDIVERIDKTPSD